MPSADHPSVQATEPTYELHSLGWKAFQQLCATIAGEVFGQVIQGYFDSNDGGRDGAFHGTWKRQTEEAFEGSFTIQCKFTSKPDSLLKLSDLTEEMPKARRLAAKGLADTYLLFTNAKLTGTSDETIGAAFLEIPGIRHFAAYGVERISQIIRESPRLRMLVPRVYGLGDLSQILDERACAQAREILSALGDDLAKFVITDAYERSAKAIVEHGFVLLLGEPACGKSTIAAALALGALDEWECSTIKIRDADDLVRHSNPNEPKQFFWIDDAFGATQIDWQSTIRWNQAFPHIQAAIRRGAKFVFTSRDYIYRSARNLLKASALPLLNEAQVVIQVEKLGKEEREQILYNHIRLGMQSKQFKSDVRPFLPVVAAHRRFSPEIARRLGNPAFTKKLYMSTFDLQQFVEHPMELLEEIIRTLDSDSRSAIALVFMRGGALASPMTLAPDEMRAIPMLGGSEAGVRSAIGALDGSLLLQVREGGEFFWRFKHPTVRDAFAKLVAEDRELMDIYLMGTPVRQLFGEVSCGDVDLQGVKVIVPPDRFDIVLSRMPELGGPLSESREMILNFISRRCSRDFIEQYINRHPTFVPGLQVGSYLYAVSDVDVIVRLNALDILPEAERQRHVAGIRGLAVDTPDAGFLREDIQSLLTQAERADILLHVRDELLPNLADCVETWEDNFDRNEDASDYFRPLKEALDDYREAFNSDQVAIEQINAGLSAVSAAIDRLNSEAPDERDDDEYRGSRPSGPELTRSRSIFDDVDQ